MTRSRRQAVARPRRQRHTAALLGTVLFLVLAASGAAHAAWTTAASPATGSVTSGSISIAQSGFDQLNFDYSASSLVTTKPVTVSNGAVPSTYALTLAGTSATAGLAGAITVTTWPVASTAHCTSSTTLPGSETVRTWTSGTTLTGSVAADSSVVYCVRTSISSPIPAAYGGGHVAARLDLTAAVGTNWKAAPVTVAVAQTVPDTTAPTAPTGLTSSSTTDAATTLAWTAATDNVGIASYRVYRDTVLVRSVVAGTTFTDTGLNVGTTYSYTVDALDAAGNSSAMSSAVTATTSQSPSSTSWYRVKSGGLCVTGSTNANGPVTVQVCNESLTTQLWRYDLVNPSNYLITSQAAAGLAWQRTTTAAVVMATRNVSDSSQQWGGTLSGNGLYQFVMQVNRNKTECITVPSYTAGTALQTQSCSAGSAQQFTLTAAN
ncbi:MULTISPECIES: RICIN domain-containing protein [unclassified Cryobacterium]|uniref:fibronectin type III domain-containing protein n=1 Tax=unclassified Cryobacterium TaxID=2649013 RepID=UPI00106B40D5|nr:MULTISPECIES: RICIN domain-containing protein [unclassified Cryobacterium]TFD07063.1 hypothetical protein E3T29_08640 [Cryobacterium sp. TMT1-66-1]TFD13366.1 hypothetical protein E3T35_04305 [Cryobacterium sp. TMT1-2-2]